MKPVVFLALPTYNRQREDGSAAAAYLYPSHGRAKVITGRSMNSLLAHGFNGLWCDALNRRESMGITHFAMLHSDVAPERFWLDKLLAEMDKHKLSVVSAVIPIKSDQGLTSTAIDVRGRPECMPKRLTMAEVHELPVTFTAADTEYPDKPLLVNTGCWVCDFSQPWAEKIVFTIRDWIVRAGDGKFCAISEPEDWNFSRQLHEMGVPYGATRAVQLNHFGAFAYGNDTVWGMWQTDELFKAQEEYLAEAIPVAST